MINLKIHIKAKKFTLERLLFFIIFSMSFLICSCLFFSSEVNNLPSSSSYKENEKIDVSIGNYQKITNSAMDISSSINDSSKVYMLVYNMGDTQVSSENYKTIFAGHSRALAESLEYVEGKNTDLVEPSPHIHCGFSMEEVKNAYLKPHIIENSTNRVATTSYDRTKNKKAASIGDTGSFYVRYTSGGSSGIKKIDATCRYLNDVCQIFVEDDYYDSASTEKFSEKTSGSGFNKQTISYITALGAKTIAEKFSLIYEPQQKLLGSISLDNLNIPNVIETPEKVTILLSNLGNSGSEMTIGYFYTSDLYYDINFDSYGNSVRYSNQRLMFTLNTISFTKDDESTFYSSLGHEFNHAINFINKVLKNNKTFDVWFSEMLSAITEDFIPDILGIENTVQGMRVPFFNYKPYNGMIDWNSNKTYAYGFAYVFGAYLVRNFGGINFVHELATNAYTGTEAISKALAACGYNETYNSALLKFGTIMANAYGMDTTNPTLYKSVTGTIDDYTYIFPKVDLYAYSPVIDLVYQANFAYQALRYENPNWDSNNLAGPCFYKVDKDNNIIYFPSTLYPNSFYATYLGDSSKWNYSALKFNPPSGSIQAYIYVTQ